MARNELSVENLTGPQKAAIFFLSMGQEFTTSFFKNLDEGYIKKIGKYMSEITYISSDVLTVVMNEFLMNFRNEANLAVSGRDFLKQVVNRTLDEKTAGEVFKIIGDKDADVPFSDLAYMPADNLVNIIKAEHPQTIALILAYLPQGTAAEVLGLLPVEIKSDIALRIVKLEQVQDDIIRELDEAIKKDISRVGRASRKFNGVETLANILNEVDGNTEEAVLSHIEKEDDDLADKVRQKMFVFEDLLQTEDRSFREILKNIDNQLLTRALKTASDEMKEKIFSNLSERAADMLKEDMEIMGPIRLKEVEEAQQNIIKNAKRLETEGKIVLVGKGKEEVFV